MTHLCLDPAFLSWETALQSFRKAKIGCKELSMIYRHRNSSMMFRFQHYRMFFHVLKHDGETQ